MTNFGVGLRQVVVRDARPQVMDGVEVHVHRRQEQPFDRVGDIRHQPMVVRFVIRPDHRVLSEGAKIVAQKRE